MKKTMRSSSFVRAALGGAALGLTLVAGVSQSAYAQQQANPAPITDATPSPDISANAGPSPDISASAAPAAQPPARTLIVSPYTPPSMGGSDIPSNHRGAHGDGNSNS